MVMRTSSLFSIALLGVVIATAGVAVIRRWQSSGQIMRKGSVIELAGGGDLQAALEQARPGDTIILQAGAIYEGPFTLPVKTGSEFITIHSAKLPELPECVLVSPSPSALLAKIQAADKVSPIVKTEPPAHHYKFAGIEFSTTNEKVVARELIR